MKDMTDDEARAEAVRRWGPGGAIRLSNDIQRPGRVRRGRLARYRCMVGNGNLGKGCSAMGQGDTWREAFLDVREVGATARR
jgi:hypothetical protein